MKKWILFFLCCPTILFAKKSNEELLQDAKVGNDSIKTLSYYQLAKNYLRISTDTCRLYALQSLALAKKLNMKRYIGENFSILGAAEKNDGNFEKAIAYHLESIVIKEKMNDTIGLSIANNDIGIVYKSMERFKEALPYYRKSNTYAQLAHFDKGISMTYSNIGTIYSAIEQNDSAVFYYEKAMQYAKSKNDSSSLVNAMANLGEIYTTLKQYDKALYYLKQCIPIDQAFDDRYGLALDYINIANVLSNLKQHDQALTYIDKGIEYAQDAGMVKEILLGYNTKAGIYKTMHQYDKAVDWMDKARIMRDSIVNTETNLQVSELSTKYETEKKEKEILIQKNKITKQRIWIFSILGLLATAISLGWARYRRLKIQDEIKLQKAIQEQEVKALKSVMEAEEKERERIALELHDGVGQLMSAAKLNLNAFETQIDLTDEKKKNLFQKISDLISDSAKEVRSVAHNMMPNVLLKKGLTQAIQEFINKIDHNVLKINLHTEGIQRQIATDKESVLYRVIQECVNNVIKHAQANHLDIALINEDQGISITIEDNGVGFDWNALSEHEGMGVKNIKSRIEYLNGSVEFDSALGRGTVVSIFVPTN
ncbi:MAG: sensor histidine kinase [Chitinophagaceae bacterium]